MRSLLNPTEAEVYDWLVQGLSNKQIAWRQSAGVGTIKNQVSVILKKTRKQSRVQLVVAHYKGVLSGR